jgi:hypothetical protein
MTLTNLYPAGATAYVGNNDFKGSGLARIESHYQGTAAVFDRELNTTPTTPAISRMASVAAFFSVLTAIIGIVGEITTNIMGFGVLTGMGLTVLAALVLFHERQ